MSTYSLSGSGTQALSTGTTALRVTITILPAGLTSGRANPTNHFDIGMLRFSDGIAYWSPIPIMGGPHWIGLPTGTVSIAYALLHGAHVDVTEVIGGVSPFGVASGLFPEGLSLFTPLASTSAYSWTNQGSASASLSANSLFLQTPGASASGLRVFTRARPIGSYTFTVALKILTLSSAVGSTLEPAAGLVFRESSTGKIHACSIAFLPASATSGTSAIQSRKWTNATTFSADYKNTPSGFAAGPGVKWLRISDDGTNRKFDVSEDGINWLNFTTVTRLDFLTSGADQVGFFLRSDNDASSTVAASILSVNP